MIISRGRTAGTEGGGMTIPERLSALRVELMPAILECIDRVVDETTPTGSVLVSMCRYHMETGGKRLRAVIPLLVAECLGVPPARLVPFGAACEMLHNATLVHDDLQDGDTARRGRQTVWHRFGAEEAINLGDAMFYYALLLLQELEVDPVLRERISRHFLVDTLSVIDGQSREFALRDDARPLLGDYFSMVEGKTSTLFGLPIAGAALLCGVEPPLIASLKRASQHLGVLFQIQDDILDIWGDKGRETAGDLREGKRSVLVTLACQRGSDTQWARLRAILDKPRAETREEDIDQAVALFEKLEVERLAREEIERRQGAALAEVAGHDVLSALMAGLCEVFLEPISSSRACTQR